MKSAAKQFADELIVCGMWGTSSLTLSLVDARTGEILETRAGRGVSKLERDEIEIELFDICGHWLSNHEVSEIFLAGMVGSTIGWWEVPYLECPATLWEISAHSSSKLVNGIRVWISPGLKCGNFLGELDVIRGEEIELLAWLRARPLTRRTRSLVCIPGTHTKWVEIVGNEVTRFQTSIVGEVFDLLTANGVLVTKIRNANISSEEAFLCGVEDAAKHPQSLLQLLMSVRARSLLAGQSPEEASDRLSGLLIGADVSNALALAEFREEMDILPVIGAKNLAERYAIALRHLELTPLSLSALNIGVAGLLELARSSRTQ